MTTTWIAGGGEGEEPYTDIRYEKSAPPDQGIAKITIARPEVRNAFRPRTVIEMARALTDAQRGHRGRRDRAHRRRARGVLLRRRPARAGRLGISQRRRRRQGRGGAVPRDRPASADPPAAQARRGDGRRIRDRRRARAASRVRSDDRRRERALRAGRPQGRLLRRRLRRGPAGEHGGAEEGEGDLVPVPAVLRARRRSRWGS